VSAFEAYSSLKMSTTVPEIEKYAPSSSGSSETSDILDFKDDEGWEDAEADVEEEQFISLLDDEVFTDIRSMLDHCKVKFNFDFLEIRQRLALDFYGNVKLVNFIRSQVHSGHPVSSAISREDFEDERFLKPVLEDDALLINLDDLPEVQANAQVSVGVTHNGKETSNDSGRLVARVSELEEELRRIQSQFEDYRTTVKQTLDERWNDKSSGEPSRSAGMKKEEKRDDDSHYFSSYSYNG
jgi:protein arginine N-methyltransferase 3